ncbi:MAG TPA: AMP-binding protein [Actinomycetota bacterium]|nr:AMP-binding protein [Actinomycetota bacterium]
MLEVGNFWDLIERRARLTPDARMAVDETGRVMTFAQYRNDAERAAAGLQDMGIGRGTVVSWQLPTWLESFVLCAALSRLEAIQNPILPIYREREVGFIARQAKTKLLIVPSVWRNFAFEEMARGIAQTSDGLEVLVSDKSLPQGDPKTVPAPPSKTSAAEAPVRWLFYTSGTTADPKGAQHTDYTIAATALGMSERLALTEDDRSGVVFPFTHIAGPIWLMSALMTGCTLIIDEAFDPVRTTQFLKDNDVTLAGSGTIFHMAYLKAQREQPDTPLFAKVRAFPGGGAPKPPQLHYDMVKEMHAPIVSGYGLTESPILTMASADDGDQALANTEGRAMRGVDLRVVTMEGKVAGIGEEGEIRAKAPQLMRGYLDMALDKDAFDEDGYFRTGDLGKLDADGNVTITGRLKDIIIRKGENISAKEVEDLLFQHPKVADVAVIGLPDPASGEIACAVVALKDGTLTLLEVAQFLKEKGLRNQAIPERLEILDALPRNPAGKVLKQDLKKQFA